ncbi:MAG: SprT-like domain-containing protein [Phycisphaerae bacterium]|jgi:predicted SprT family Zn-dependent metalloprotease|nr:SprT-like domain-containing protein [Phycisphaerae bacterium]
MSSRKTRVLFDFSDLWKTGDPLPARATLKAIADRCGQAWEIPDLARRVTIVYNPRLRTTLGRAILDDNRVELNVHLLRAYPDELLVTVVHELAHLAVRMRYGKVRPHGREFKALMGAVNMSADATHHLDTARVKLQRRRYVYLHRCADCGMMFIARKPRRDCYCKACGPEMSWNILRAPATTAGRRKLKEIMDSA